MTVGAAQRVYWFAPSLGGGGAERVVVDIANAMVRRGIDVEVVLAGQRGVLAEQLDNRIGVTTLEADGVLSSIPALKRWLDRAPPGPLVSVMDHANVAAWIAARLSRTQVTNVFTSHLDFSHGFEELPRLVRASVIAGYARIYRRATLRIAVSMGVARSLAAALRVRESCIDVIENPVPIERINALAAAEVAADLLPDEEVPIVVGVGRLVPQKDFATLLRAFARVVRERPARLVILGEGGDRAALVELADDLGISSQMRLPGFVDNPYAVLRRAKLFVSSSRWEGFGIAIVEALALGCPVVATDCPSGPAEILGGGAYGRLVPVGDEVALAAAMGEVLNAPPPAQKLISRAREFDVDVIADRYVALLNDTVR